MAGARAVDGLLPIDNMITTAIDQAIKLANGQPIETHPAVYRHPGAARIGDNWAVLPIMSGPDKRSAIGHHHP